MGDASGFVGRSDERLALADICRDAAQRRGALVLVAGEAGFPQTEVKQLTHDIQNQITICRRDSRRN